MKESSINLINVFKLALLDNKNILSITNNTIPEDKNYNINIDDRILTLTENKNNRQYPYRLIFKYKYADDDLLQDISFIDGKDLIIKFKTINSNEFFLSNKYDKDIIVNNDKEHFLSPSETAAFIFQKVNNKCLKSDKCTVDEIIETIGILLSSKIKKYLPSSEILYWEEVIDNLKKGNND